MYVQQAEDVYWIIELNGITFIKYTKYFLNAFVFIHSVEQQKMWNLFV